MKKTIEIVPPQMPNFAKGKDAGQVYDIGQFTKEEAEAYANMMREEFLRHWEKRNKMIKALV